MPTLRSASVKSTRGKRTKTQASSEDEELNDISATPRTPRKRARVEDADASPTPKAKRTSSPKKPAASASDPVVITAPRGLEPELVPAQLSFDLEVAKQHLIKVDARFATLFERRACKPYEVLTTVDPFRTLATSIL